MIRFFKLLWDGVKSDFNTLKLIFTGKARLRTDIYKSIDLVDVFKENWMMFLLIILGVLVGIWISSQHYQSVCNEIIIEMQRNSTVQDWFNISLDSLVY